VFVSIKHNQKEKNYADPGTRTHTVRLRRVLLSRLNALGYLKQEPLRKLVSRTPREINDLLFMF